jgi:glycosyltransferase involved in cell wall biosynthesis
MRILFLSNVVPYPVTDGGRQRIHYLLETLVEHYEVTFCGFTRGSQDETEWPASRRLLTPPLLARLDRPEASGGDHGGLRAAADVPWWARTKGFARLERSGLWENVSRLPLDSIDAVHCETNLVGPIAVAMKRMKPSLRLVLDLPDVAWHLKARALRRALTGVSRDLMRRSLETAKTYMLDARMYRQFDRILVCSEVDAARVRTLAPQSHITVVPNCTNTAVPVHPSTAESRRLVFVGSMSYGPNEVAATFFSDHVLPRIRRVIPDVEFWIVGKNPSERVRRLATVPGIHVTGAVPDVQPYLRDAAAVVVPVLTGGGTRLKILEAMAAQRAVVSTSIGAEGIDAVDGRDLLLADGPDEFAARCVDLLRDRTLRERIAAAGRVRVLQKYDWKHAQARLLSCYGELLS